MADSTSVGVLSNIFTAPSLAFAAIKERPNPWLPLLVLMTGVFLQQFMYMQAVDYPWLMDQQLQQAGGMTEEQRAQTVDMMTSLPPSVMGTIYGVGGAISVLVIYALIALYYLGVSFATNDKTKYQQWLALIAWCSLPSVLGIIASLVNLQVTDARFLLPTQLNPLSFGSLLNLDPQGATTVETTLMALDVTIFWSTVLQILGYQAFTQRSFTFATAVVLGPLALIALIASLFALT
ncbi:MAG TPA: YIP1 family protein [Gammaproteobacteria bacterium]|nr:YIP1 family protein [Gammaproteobacteria bacterium]